MSIGTPNGILDITGATLRVSKMEFRQSTGFDTVLNNVARNTMLLMDETEQTTSNSWALKLPNAWVAEFHGYWASGSSGAPILFNFYNDSTSGTNGYTLSMNDTAISINYDGGSALGSATLSSTLNNDAYRKVAIIFERSVLDVSVDGEHVFHFADSQLRDRVYDNNSGYVTFTHSSTDERKLKNLKFTNGDKWIREIDSSNIAYVGGNVGIGTTIPGTKLDVSGTVRGTHLIGDGSAISAIQSSNVSDFGSNVTRIGTLETDLGDNSARITNLSSNLSDNSSRITALESGDISISGDKTFTGDIIFESNVHMNSGNVFVANTVNMTVSDPIIELGSNNLNTNDLGIIMTRHGATNSNVAIVYDENVDILRMGYTLNGASDSVVDLDSNALAVSVQGALSAANITTDDYLIHSGDTDTKVGFPSADTFTVATANNERLRVDSSGNVGIGTNNPSTKLNMKGGVFLAENQSSTNNQILYGDGGGTGSNNNSYTIANAKFGTGVFVNDTGTTGSTITLVNKEGANNTTKHASIGFVTTDTTDNGKFGGQIGFWPEDANASTQQFRIYTSGASAGYNLPVQQMVVDGDGNVGIGTPSPDTKLTLSIGAITTSANIARFHSSYDSANNGYLTIEENNHTPNNNDWTGYGTRIQKMVDSTYQGYIEFNPVGGQYSTAFGMGGTEYMRIEYPDGNVGIGTSNPVGKLDVWDGASNGTNIQQNAFFYLRNPANAATNYGAAIVFENTDGAGGTRKGLGRIAALRENNSANYSSYLQFSPTVAGTEFEAMRLTSSGNVGIGTTGPGATLDIRGATDDPSTPTVHIGDNNADTGDYGMVNLVRDATNGGSKSHLAFIRHGSTVVGMGFHNNTNTWGIFPSFGSVTNTPALAIDSGSRVGIGTAGPGADLDVFNSSHDTGYREMAWFRVSNINTHANWTRMIFGQSSTNNCFIDITNQANTKGNLYLQPYGGSIGIGATSTPKQKLQITNGHIALVSTAWKSNANDDQLAGKIDFHLGGDSGQQATPVASIEGYDKWQGGSYYGALAFKIMGSEKIRIDEEGTLEMWNGLNSIQLYNSTVNMTSGQWHAIGTFAGYTTGCYLITVRWGTSNNSTYWYGGASCVARIVGGSATPLYNWAPEEELQMSQWYHHRTVSQFEFILDSDNNTTSYGRTTLWVKSYATTPLSWTTNITLLQALS